MVSRKHAAVAALTAVALTAPAIALADNAVAAKRKGYYAKKVLSTKYAGPLQFAVGQHVYVADSFASTLTKLGSSKVLATGGNPKTGGDVAGVGVNSAAGEVGYTWSGGAHKQTKFALLRNGKLVYTVNLAAQEGKTNPDKVLHYGVDKPSTCVKNALTKAHIPVSYTGELDSHPYSTTYLGSGQWAVADAGANAIFKVDTVKRLVSTLAVLPRQPLVISKAFAQASKLPPCVVGVTYNFESVPTDVETGPGGLLYASTLPGGPEGAPGIPPRGKIYTISATGAIKLVGKGFDNLTNIAVRPNGTVYAAELGAGRVTQLVNGRPGPALYSHAGLVGVEWANGHLYVSNVPNLIGVNSHSSIVQLGYAG